MQVCVSNFLKVGAETAAEVEALERAKRSLEMDNPKFQKLVNLGKSTWNVPERLVFHRGNKLPRGYAMEFAREIQGIPCEWIDFRNHLPEEHFVFQGELRTYQKEALASTAKVSQGIIVAPCGSGKTIMAMKLIEEKKQPTIFLVHTKDLLNQAAEAVRTWLGEDPGIIGDGKREIRRVTIATIQSLRHEDKCEDLLMRFGMLIVDECHHVPALTFTDVISRFPAKFRYGLTATPERSDGLERVINLVLGEVLHTITHEDLEDSGMLVKPVIGWVQTNFTYAYEDDYQNMISAVTQDSSRNECILRLCKAVFKKNRKALLLSSRVSHCKILFDSLCHQGFQDRVLLVTGSTKKSERQSRIEQMRDGKFDILIASNIADEGLDIPILDTLILATPFRAKSKALQRIGRILRPHGDKEAPLVVDFFDKKTPILQFQAWARHSEVYSEIADNPDPPSKPQYIIPEEGERSEKLLKQQALAY